MTHPVHPASLVAPHPLCSAPHCTPDHAHHSRKRIRLFHPRKVWVSLATVALTVGMAVGQFQYQSTHPSDQKIGRGNEWLYASKINEKMQTFSLWGDGGKQGIEPFKFRVSRLGKEDVAMAADLLKQHKNKNVRSGVKRVCFWEDEVTEPEYKAEVVEVKLSEAIEPGAVFQTEVLIKNNGNVTWYSHQSDCENKTVVNLGTVKALDRASVFFTSGAGGETGWIGDNRVALLEDAVLPGDMATFSFRSKAPLTESLYREYFGLVAENVTWFEGFEVPVDIPVGNITEEDRSKVRFIKNLTMDTRSLTGERWLEVDISEQKIKFHFGDLVVYTIPISSGAAKTPTPLGTWKIFLKQELRIGGAPPHYRMPYFQMFTKGGAGLHELPYLATDGGVFWKEALNHIGIPVSHGCIRMLPGDAVLIYAFTEIGTKIDIHK